MDYVIRETGQKCNKGRDIEYEIVGILFGNVPTVEGYLKENMKPGDTTQWIYETTETAVFSYEETLKQWAGIDAYMASR